MMTRKSRQVLGTLIPGLLISSLLLTGWGANAQARRKHTSVRPAAQTTAGRSENSIAFVENVGQFDDDVRFLVYGSNQDQLWLTDNEVWLTKEGAEQGQAIAIRLTFPGASAHPRLEPFGARETVFNYYHGNDPSRWYAEVPVWSGVRYVDLYPGVELEISGVGGRWTWRLNPRNSQALENVKLQVEGSENVLVDGGFLHLTTAAGDVKTPLLTVNTLPSEKKPEILSRVGNVFEVVNPFGMDAQIATQRSQGALDNPDVLLYSTFLGGSSDDEPHGAAVNTDGEVYVTGSTESAGFPTKPGAFDSSFDGDSEIFVTRLNADGSDLVYSTFLGGTAVMTETVNETGWDIAVDENGVAYIAGESSTDDFPTTPGAYSTIHIPANPDDVFPDSPPASDIVIVKLDASGAMVYGAYFAPPLTGGGGMGIAVDASGVIHMAGLVAASDFPTTEGAYNQAFGYSGDFFVLKFNPAGQGKDDLLYSTYVAESATPTETGAQETFGDMALENGVVYVVGSTEGEFPTTDGAYDTTFNGALPCQNFPCPANVVFFKLDPAGNGADDLLYSTYLGGTTPINDQRGEGIAVDAAGIVYLTGNTWAEDFPITPGAFDTKYDGSYSDNFVSKLDPASRGAADLLYSTFLGGSYFDNVGDAVAVDDAGDIYVIGDTYSDDFPVTSDAYQGEGAGFTDVTVTRLRPQGDGEADLIYSTYLGGDTMDYGRDIAVGQGETVYVAGYTNSSDFPTTDGAYDTSFGGGTCGSYSCDDAFVARLNVAPSLLDLSASTKTVYPAEAAAGQVVTFTVRLVNSGDISAAVTVTDTLPTALIPRGAPSASSGPAPILAGQTLTWVGSVLTETTVTLTYAAELTSTSTLTPTAVNEAQIDDGVGNVYTRRAFVNACNIFLPLVFKSQ